MNATPDRHAFGTGGLRAAVLAQGAELCDLRSADGLELLWPAAPVWPRHAPVLFPIVGRLKDDRLLHQGRFTTLTQHGFARDLRFAWVEADEDGCRLALTDSDFTRARYPFRFRLELDYRVSGNTLAVSYRVTNPGEEVLPVSFGAHPAFRWPLDPRAPKESHKIVFAAAEPSLLRRVSGGLLTAADRPSPVQGRHLKLTEALFADDALIWEAPASRAVRYGAPNGPALEIRWEGFSQLGIWSRAGGDFVCIEPWQGMASPAGFEGEFLEKPWLCHVQPGETRCARWSVEVISAGVP